MLYAFIRSNSVRKNIDVRGNLQAKNQKPIDDPFYLLETLPKSTLLENHLQFQGLNPSCVNWEETLKEILIVVTPCDQLFRDLSSEVYWSAFR